ncbi:MAG: methylated-DNA--[protein]-cysteine S-methyltransferase [Betaproteobacteria bacterium]|nr:methylated-DNA--[protein]-cysteine S-methyltransferase [Betaproteobacteria bacterium]
MIHCDIDTPIGVFHALSDGQALLALRFDEEWERVRPGDRGAREPDAPVLRDVREQLRQYFTGLRTWFDLPLAPSGTAFQHRVWAALRDLAYADTTSYAALARTLGCPRSARAVGAANGANPLPVIVPCHRVVGSDGTLTGYAGGLSRKRWLLAHEHRHAPEAGIRLIA